MLCLPGEGTEILQMNIATHTHGATQVSVNQPCYPHKYIKKRQNSLKSPKPVGQQHRPPLCSPVVDLQEGQVGLGGDLPLLVLRRVGVLEKRDGQQNGILVCKVAAPSRGKKNKINKMHLFSLPPPSLVASWTCKIEGTTISPVSLRLFSKAFPWRKRRTCASFSDFTTVF